MDPIHAIFSADPRPLPMPKAEVLFIAPLWLVGADGRLRARSILEVEDDLLTLGDLLIEVTHRLDLYPWGERGTRLEGLLIFRSADGELRWATCDADVLDLAPGDCLFAVQA